MEDKLILGGKEFKSRFILGSGKYNLNLINAAVEQGGAEIITLALRRANTKESENILDYIPKGVTLLPNNFWCTKCRGGSSYCETEPCNGLW
mgnify:CR=1 FL=1